MHSTCLDHKKTLAETAFSETATKLVLSERTRLHGRCKGLRASTRETLVQHLTRERQTRLMVWCCNDGVLLVGQKESMRVVNMISCWHFAIADYQSTDQGNEIDN